MAERDLIVIGASAGGLEALQAVAAGLPQELPAAVCVVWHLAPESPGLLPEILARAGPLPARNARDREPLERGQIFVAPPGRHLIVEEGYLRTTRGPRENRFRPAIDPLFRSAAAVFGARVIGVVLSGALDDGTAGLRCIQERGGLAIVQDPTEAPEPSMPGSALAALKVDGCLPASQIGPRLVQLCGSSVADAGELPIDEQLAIELRIAAEENALASGVERLGRLSAFACPECHGTLRELRDGPIIRFRCHTGHAYTAQALLAEGTAAIEDYLWTAVRGIEEKVRLLHDLSQHCSEHGRHREAKALQEQAAAAQHRADPVRKALLSPPSEPESSGRS